MGLAHEHACSGLGHEHILMVQTHEIMLVRSLCKRAASGLACRVIMRANIPRESVACPSAEYNVHELCGHAS